MFERTANRLRRALQLVKKTLNRDGEHTKDDEGQTESQSPGPSRLPRPRKQKKSDSQSAPDTQTSDDQDTPAPALPKHFDLSQPDAGVPFDFDKSERTFIEGNEGLDDPSNFQTFRLTYLAAKNYIDSSPLAHCYEYYAIIYLPTSTGSGRWEIYVA